MANWVLLINMSKLNRSSHDNVASVPHSHSTSMSDYVEVIEKVQKSVRAANKTCRSQLREIAQLLVYQHLHSEPVSRVACFHRDDGDSEFMNTLANGLTEQVTCP